MAGTRAGGLKSKEHLLAKDPDHYAKLGQKGGSATRKSPAGFGHMAIHDPERLRRISAKGGEISKRRKSST